MSLLSGALARICRDRPARVIDTGGKPYLYRVFLFELWGWRCYLHHFVSADAEHWLHDHPFNGYALVLTGGYVEERLVAFDWPHLLTEERRVRWFNAVAGTCFHRVLSPRRNTWTLFLHTPKYKGWGFLEHASEYIVYHNPHGNVGNERWWETAPTYGQLRFQYADAENRRALAIDQTINEFNTRVSQ